ncbi:hypothetical protein [Streptomyces sp. NBC_00996]|uniref:hypothetical protein n=1 Tax=Streptomyces sp. NBC_00996 TaxID=2903710 RepID=UPI003867D373|nr:hypothetical protein OG390_09220 [Streptomyces sp. NBC_00996]
MSRGEETDEPITGDEHLVPGEPAELSKPEPAGDAPEPSPFLAVVISGDGSAAIDGVPVPTAEGEAVDVAILDALHGHARDRNATVTAAISDPAAGYVAFVEVAPDGSSTLLEQHGEQPPEQGEPAVPTGPYGHETEAGPSGVDDDVDEDLETELDGHRDDDLDEGPHDDPEDELDLDLDELDEAAYALPQPSGPPPPPPAFSSTQASPSASNPSRSPSPEIGRRGELRQSDNEFEGPRLLHRPLVVGPVALGVAALVIVPLVMLGSGGSGGGGDETQAARATSDASRSPSAEEPAPTVSVTPSMMPSPPSATPTTPKAKPKDTQGSKGSKGGGSVTVTVTARPPRTTVTAKPPQDTAATAVNRLAKSDPGGRHICYRAYLSGQGWQKPVCDGTLAGTTGQNKPIKSINIAVTGSGGSAANAFVHDAKSTNGQGKWIPKWTDVIADGKNNYIGSTKASAPYMTGFVINIGSGRICETAKVHGYDWGGQGCADPRPGYIFGGALENTRYLEAVKFTV